MKPILYCLMVLLITGCKEKYESPVVSPVTGYLVVDGVINSGPGTASLTLSRTTKFDNRNIVYEKGAGVTVQGEDSSVYALLEKGQGIYSADNLNLKNTLKYRLRINASNGKRYLSDFVVVKNNPPIDSISWKIENNGVQLYVNTHDARNNARYYQWYYDEAWQIQSSYYSTLKYKITHSQSGDNYTVVYRDSTTFSYDPTIVNCWQFNAPLNLFLGSTAKLSQDIIYLPVNYIPPASIKLGVMYSIRLKQYTWTKEGYEFLEKMKRNTESTGSVFDPQPSELKGNISCISDASETVIGFFNISPVQEKRIFIRRSDVPSWQYAAGCFDVEIENVSDSIAHKALGLLPTVVEKQSPFGGIVTFKAAPPDCVDCTLRGSNKKPSYWP
ncbi:MAG: DUF4249 domain-containing protein [Chitinophagaceae bacterium]